MFNYSLLSAYNILPAYFPFEKFLLLKLQKSVILKIWEATFHIYAVLNEDFLSLFCSPGLRLFDQKYSKNGNTMKLFQITVFYVNIS